jgi:AraC-like DNA-binding protein
MLLCLHSLSGENSHPQSFFDVTKYIETHFNENLTLEILAKKFFMSKFTFLRKFKKHTGMGLPSYLNTIRIINAKKMLADGARVLEAAMACGFESLSSFDRVFRRECKMTPREYKRLISEKNPS